MATETVALNALDAAFSEKVRARRKLLVPFVTAGFPTLDATPAIVEALAAAGADAVEIGIPFSDPLADGPVIQRSSQRALENGVTLQGALAMARTIPKTIPLLVMGYVNPIERFGTQRFAEELARSGITGVIVPDLPLGEAGELREALARAKVHYVPLAAPTTREERLAALGEAATAFLYCVSVAGTTGGRELPKDLEKFLARARRATSKPRLVGFGISDAASARRAAAAAEGVIVGSALLEAIGGAADPAAAARRFLEPLREALG
jgi:tryptophan synthase alpha chain